PARTYAARIHVAADRLARVEGGGPSRLAAAEQLATPIGEDVDYLAGGEAALHSLPEFDLEQIAVAGEEHVPQAPGRRQESPELLGENVLLAHVEPGLGGEFLLDRRGLGNAAEAALRQEAELVVIVADHPAVPRHPEILEQHVSGEDVGRGEILDRVAEIGDRLACGRLVG